MPDQALHKLKRHHLVNLVSIAGRNTFENISFEARHREGSKLSFGKSNMNNVEAIAFQESDHDPAWI